MFSVEFDGNNISLREISRLAYVPISAGKALYWDFFKMFEEMCHGLQKMQSDGPIVSLGIDSFSNDFSFINSHGDLLMPVRCYRDARTQNYKEAIYAICPPRELYFYTGNQLAAFSTLMQLAAMQLSPDGKIPEQSKKLLLVPDILIYFISGAIRTEYTIASVTQMYSFNNGAWEPNLLRKFSIPEQILPTIQRPATNCGQADAVYCREWGLHPFSVVSVCEHDTASAFVACPCPSDSIIISSGTWSLVGVETPHPILTETGFRYNIANEGGISGRHRLIRNVMGLWILQQLLLEFPDATYGQLEESVAKCRPFQFYIDVDREVYFSPLRMRRKICDECLARYGKAPESFGEFARCVLESLAMKYCWAFDKLERVSKKNISQVWLIGGGSRNKQLCQMTANFSGRPVFAALPEATAVGNGIMQLVAAGELRNVEESKTMISNSFSPIVYEPEKYFLGTEEYCRYLHLLNLE